MHRSKTRAVNCAVDKLLTKNPDEKKNGGLLDVIKFRAESLQNGDRFWMDRGVTPSGRESGISINKRITWPVFIQTVNKRRWTVKRSQNKRTLKSSIALFMACAEMGGKNAKVRAKFEFFFSDARSIGLWFWSSYDWLNFKRRMFFWYWVVKCGCCIWKCWEKFSFCEWLNWIGDLYSWRVQLNFLNNIYIQLWFIVI